MSEVKDAPVVQRLVPTGHEHELPLPLTYSILLLWSCRCDCRQGWFLRAEIPDQNQKRADYNTGVGKHIAVIAVKRAGLSGRDRRVRDVFDKQGRRFDDLSERIDEPGNSRVGRSGE